RFIDKNYAGAPTTVYMGERLRQRLNDDKLKQVATAFIARRDAIEGEFRQLVGKHQGADVTETLNNLLKVKRFQKLVDAQYDVHRFLFDQDGWISETRA